jgi:spore coat polysaccharide biosynthesis protein SpsF
MPKTVVLIQCRESSTRFPSKCWAKLHGKELVRWVVEKAKNARRVDEVHIVSPHKLSQDPGCSVMVWEKDEMDVLGRFVFAVKETKAKWVVRLTADCPLVRAEDIDRACRIAEEIDADLTTNALLRVSSQGYADGFDVEIIKGSVLQEIYPKANESQKEHVTTYLKENPQSFLLVGLGGDYPIGKWSVDTLQDLERLEGLTNSNGDVFNNWRNRVVW